jgi:hypothetical protein
MYSILVTVQDPGKSDRYTANISRLTQCGPPMTGQILFAGSPPTTVVPPVTPDPPPSTGDDSQNETDDLCASPSGELGWVICPMSTFVMEGAMAIDEFIIDNFLKLDTESIFGGPAQGDQESSGAYRTAHGAFRNIAYALLILLGLIMVLSQIIGLDIFDAYTIRKMLPKMVLAAILLPLLWPLLGFLFSMANDAADAVMAIIKAPFANIGREAGATDVLAFGGTIAALIAAAGGIVVFLALGGGALSIILPVMAGLLLAVASAFLVLAIRDIIAGGIVITSSIFVVLGVFGPTYGLFKLVRRVLTTILLSVPGVAGMLMLSKVLAVLAFMGKGAWGVVIGLVFIAAGYALLWKTVKRIDQVTGQVDSAVGSATAGSRKWIATRRQKAVAETANEAGSKVIQKRARWYQQAKDRMNRDGASGTSRFLNRRLARLVGGRNIEAKASASRAAQSKVINDQIATGRDEEIRGLTVDHRLLDDFEGAERQGLAKWTDVKDENGNVIGQKKQFKSLGGAWVDENDVREGHRRWGGDAYAQQAALSYEMRKAGTEDEVKSITDNYGRVASGSWGMSDIDAGGAWIGAAFENQNTHLQFKSTNWRTGQLDNPDRLVSEIYERRNSYNLSQMAPSTFTAIENAWDQSQDAAGDTQEVLTQKAKRRSEIRAIMETFMQSPYGGGMQVGEVGGVPQTAPGPPVPPPPATTAPAAGTPTGAATTAAPTTAPASTTAVPSTAPATVTVPGAVIAPTGTTAIAAAGTPAAAATTAPAQAARQVYTSGAAHVWQRAARLATRVGVATQAPSGRVPVPAVSELVDAAGNPRPQMPGDTVLGEIPTDADQKNPVLTPPGTPGAGPGP